MLFVDETFLYDPLVRKMKRLVDDGTVRDGCHLSIVTGTAPLTSGARSLRVGETREAAKHGTTADGEVG